MNEKIEALVAQFIALGMIEARARALIEKILTAPPTADEFVDDRRIAESRGWTGLHIRTSPQLFFPGQFDRSLWGIPPGETEERRVPFFSMGEVDETHPSKEAGR